MRYLFAITLLIAAALATAADRGDEVVVTKTGDPDMDAARRQAQASLDSFLAVARTKPAGTSGFKLKVQVSDGRYTEHFWVVPFREVDGRFQGAISNEPQYVHTVKFGQLITFDRTEISDWGYVKNGRQVGSFTVCAMFKKMTTEQVDYYRKNYGFDC
jgi:uncharacterized protein YegJ (DUF2314 family)